jgi:hypothetical protein
MSPTAITSYTLHLLSPTHCVLPLCMARRKSKSEKAVTDRSLPWSDRIAAARTAVDQIPSTDWKHGVLAAFLREVEAELGDGQAAPDDALVAAPAR